MDVDMDMDMDMGSQDRFVARLLERYGVGGGPHGQPKVNFAELANDLEAKGVFRTVPSTTFLLDSNWAPAAPREKKKQREKRQRTTDEQAPPPRTRMRTRLAFPFPQPFRLSPTQTLTLVLSSSTPQSR
jgi:hypothetical protein